MATPLRKKTSVKLNTVNRLLAYYKMAKHYDYSDEEAKKVAVLSVEAEMQTGSYATIAQIMRIQRHTTHGGQETAETFDRLVAGREASEEINLWYVDGVLCDEQIVLQPETQTIAQIDAEPNAEVRRVRIERFGWPRYLREAGAVVIDVRDNDIDATKESLMEVNYKTETWKFNSETSEVVKEVHDKTRVLVCACPSTAKVFVMNVPREIESCESAQNWLHGNRSVRVIGAS